MLQLLLLQLLCFLLLLLGHRNDRAYDHSTTRATTLPTSTGTTAATSSTTTTTHVHPCDSLVDDSEALEIQLTRLLERLTRPLRSDFLGK
uniref:Putative secreted protein n=1 Tax=Anopheles triannulatus TaxID=58253 RepID=A0A2M4B3N6_9DIPT